MNHLALAARAGIVLAAAAFFVGCNQPSTPIAASGPTPSIRPTTPPDNESGRDDMTVSRPKMEPYIGKFDLKTSVDPDSKETSPAMPMGASGHMELVGQNLYSFDITIDGHKIEEGGIFAQDGHFEVKKALLDGKNFDGSQGFIPRATGYEITLEGPYMKRLNNKYPELVMTFERIGPRIETPGGH